MKLVAKLAIGMAALGLPLAAYGAGTQFGKDAKNGEAAQLDTPMPAITEAQARAIALQLANGEIAESEYEKENGAWRWSFDIRENGRIHEVGVDATTGSIVEDSWEDADDEADEVSDTDEANEQDD